MQSDSWGLSEVVARLQSHSSRGLPGARWMKQAAVAIVMCERTPESGVELLMIQRAKQEQDPWSGHMAFPGGRVDPEDLGPFEAALRESMEELGLDLQAHATAIGSLSKLPAMAGGRVLPMVISPFLFTLDTPPSMAPNEEVDEVVWVPLRLFLTPERRQTMSYRKAGVDWPLPCYNFEGHVIWGLSLQMIDEICERLRATP